MRWLVAPGPRRRGARPRRNDRTPALECLEDRRVLSISPGGEFAVLGPFLTDPSDPSGDRELRPTVPAVGHFVSGGVVKPFIAVTSESSNVLVFLPNGRGGFVRTQEIALEVGGKAAEPEGIIAGQFVGSRADDLAVACNQGAVVILRGDGHGHFGPQEPLPLPAPAEGTVFPVSLATARIGGLPYLFVSDYAGVAPDSDLLGELLVYRGNRAGDGFTLVDRLGVTRPEQIAVADFNHDGALDLAVVSADEEGGEGDRPGLNNSLTFFQGNRGGHFQFATRVPVALTPEQQGNLAVAHPVGLAVGAFHGDPTHPDVAVVNYVLQAGGHGVINVFRNQSRDRGRISFGDASEFIAAVGTDRPESHLVTVATVGLGDRLPGLAVTDAGGDSVSILHNRTRRGGGLDFGAPERIQTDLNPVGIVAAKLTGRRPRANDDLVVANKGSDTISVLKNLTRHRRRSVGTGRGR